MNLKQLLSRTRSLADDIVTGGAELWTDEQLTDYLNEAELEACIRGKLIQELETPACQLALVDEKRIYDLNPLVLDVLAARLRGQDEDLERAAIEAVRFGRRNPGRPTAYALMNDGSETAGPKLVFDRAAPEGTTDILDLHIHRRPLFPLEAEDDEPEIGIVHHDALPYWALHLAFLHRDTDAEDPQRSADMAARFTARFGFRVDANVARKQRRRRAPVVRMDYP